MRAGRIIVFAIGGSFAASFAWCALARADSGAADCLQPWCGDIGALQGDRCRTLYPETCGGCDLATAGPACGAPTGGCLQPYCAALGRETGEACRAATDGPCAYCSRARCAESGPEAERVGANGEPCPEIRSWVMIVLDASESMQIPVAGQRRWDWAADAAERLLLATPACVTDRLLWGLMMLPRSPIEGLEDPLSQCLTHEHPDVNLGRAPMTIVAAIRAREPYGGSPIAETITTAASILSRAPDADYKTILLISDGEQSCAPNDPATAITRARRDGVRTLVVGFTNARDPRTAAELDLMAQAGGLARPQRDPADPFFYDATDASRLPEILAAEVCPVLARTERCDFCDNDRDGAVDERPDIDADAPGGVCANACGELGAEVCYQGLWLCEPPALGDETEVNCLDDDCDGATDEDADARGAVCYDETRCIAGYLTCDCAVAGSAEGEGGAPSGPCCEAVRPWVEGACACPSGPCVEACATSADEDCDGVTDEGECVAARCVIAGCAVASECEEVCDGADQDGDGVTDEAEPVESEGGEARACRETDLAGAIRDGTLRCGTDEKGVPSLVCDFGSGSGDAIAVPGLSPDDYRDDCDGVDQDADGETDEDFLSLPLEARICRLPGDDAELPAEYGSGRLYCATDCGGAGGETRGEARGGGRVVCAHPGLMRVCAACRDRDDARGAAEVGGEGETEARRERCEPPAGDCDARTVPGTSPSPPPVALAQCAEARVTLGADGLWHIEGVIGEPRCLSRCDGSFAAECLVADERVTCSGCEVEGRAGVITQHCGGRRE